MLKYRNIFLVMAMAVMTVSCTKSFEEMNIDPNRPKDVTPGVILGQMQYRIVNSSIAASRNFTHQLMQEMRHVQVQMAQGYIGIS